MAYGQKLKSKFFYRRVFREVERATRQLTGPKVAIEHVGSTSTREPAGKGDIDIYVGYRNKKEMVQLKKGLTKLFGKPAKATATRARFSFYHNGTLIELQLINLNAMRKAVKLREYFNSHSAELKKYAKRIDDLRKDYLDKIWKLKTSYISKADRWEQK